MMSVWCFGYETAFWTLSAYSPRPILLAFLTSYAVSILSSALARPSYFARSILGFVSFSVTVALLILTQPVIAHSACLFLLFM
jgi:hypothetical protein